ncbi:MAG: DUF1934 domain-containing protein [Lachnospiraceae bacterium]|nr:DUF1934 domain-containing protein [Lachnospiraceae bacterium]
MKRDVIVEVSGIQMLADSKEPLELVSNGIYRKKNEKIYIKYNEITSDGYRFDCMIKVEEDTVEVTKKGPYNSCLVFKKDRCCITPYETPFGTLMIGITTKDLITLEDADILIVKIKYSLDINYDHVSECNIEIKVTSVPI